MSLMGVACELNCQSCKTWGSTKRCLSIHTSIDSDVVHKVNYFTYIIGLNLIKMLFNLSEMVKQDHLLFYGDFPKNPHGSRF